MHGGFRHVFCSGSINAGRLADLTTASAMLGDAGECALAFSKGQPKNLATHIPGYLEW